MRGCSEAIAEEQPVCWWLGLADRRGGELELLLGRHVFLDLHVKVQPGWRENRAFLNALDWRTMAAEDDT